MKNNKEKFPNSSDVCALLTDLLLAYEDMPQKRIKEIKKLLCKIDGLAVGLNNFEITFLVDDKVICVPVKIGKAKIESIKDEKY